MLVLNKHESIKSKILRANHAPYVSKTMCKAIMRASPLETKYFKTRSNDSFKGYEKHKSYCSRLYKKEKKEFNRKLNLSFVTDNSTEASDRSFYPIFNKRFDYLETLLTICRPKKALSAGSLCGPLVSSPQTKCPKKTFMLPQKYYASVLIMLSKPLKYFV